MKATEQYFPVVLFIMLYKVMLGFESVNEIQTGGAVNYAVKGDSIFLVRTVPYKVALTEGHDKILKCDHSYKSIKQKFPFEMFICKPFKP